jgi:hypothetical protein
MSGTLFLDESKGWWRWSVRTRSGFRHYPVGRITGCGTRALAEQRLADLIERGEVPAEGVPA